MATITSLNSSDSGSTSRGVINTNLANLNNDKAESSTVTAHTGASTNVHGISGSVVGSSDTQTLTNKTLTTPTIASFANATHNHTNAAGGGQLTDAALSSAVSVSKGGTGQTSLTQYGVVVGNGTSGVTVAAIGGTGTVLASNGPASNPSFQVIAGGRFACGQTSRTGATGTGTQNIAHGLGATPLLIRITALGIGTTHPFSQSHGNATSTSTETCIYHSFIDSATDEAGLDNANIIHLQDGTTQRFIANVSALDSTNITLNFSVNSGSNTCYIQWEAFA